MPHFIYSSKCIKKKLTTYVFYTAVLSIAAAFFLIMISMIAINHLSCMLLLSWKYIICSHHNIKTKPFVF